MKRIILDTDFCSDVDDAVAARTGDAGDGRAPLPGEVKGGKERERCKFATNGRRCC